MISLVMMVKNEEAGLKRAVDSVKDFVDEVIIGVDETSEDKTLEIAKTLGKVHTFKWSDSFATPRNEGIKKAKGDWILILDGHEYVTKIPKIDFSKIKTDAIRVTVEMEGGSKIQSDRIIRNTVRYKNDVHTIPNAKTWTKYLDFHIVHDRTVQDWKYRKIRNKQRDEMLVRHLTGKKDARSLFYLAQQHRDAARWKETKDTLGEYLKISTFKDEENLGRYYLAQAHYALKEKDKAIEVLNSDIAEHHYYKGYIFYQDKNYAKAIPEMLRAVQLGSSKGSFEPIADIESRAYDILSMCFYHYSQKDLARISALNSLAYRDNERVRNNLQYFL